MADWKGWLWLGGRWWYAAKGDTIHACARALSKAADEENVADPDTVLTRESGQPAAAPPGRRKPC